jgi:hypothetical protein
MLLQLLLQLLLVAMATQLGSGLVNSELYSEATPSKHTDAAWPRLIKEQMEAIPSMIHIFIFCTWMC